MPYTNTAQSPEAPSPADVSAALDRILASAEFARARRLSDFLTYVVERTLEDRADRLKGYTIAVEALRLPQQFDPDADSTVRVTATRVRVALARYYAGAGGGDPVVIELPRGSYVPTVRWAQLGPPHIWQRVRNLANRLLAVLGLSLLGPPSTQPQPVYEREIRQGQPVESAIAARARRPRLG